MDWLARAPSALSKLARNSSKASTFLVRAVTARAELRLKIVNACAELMPDSFNCLRISARGRALPLAWWVTTPSLVNSRTALSVGLAKSIIMAWRARPARPASRPVSPNKERAVVTSLKFKPCCSAIAPANLKPSASPRIVTFAPAAAWAKTSDMPANSVASLPNDFSIRTAMLAAISVDTPLAVAKLATVSKATPTSLAW